MELSRLSSTKSWLFAQLTTRRKTSCAAHGPLSYLVLNLLIARLGTGCRDVGSVRSSDDGKHTTICYRVEIEIRSTLVYSRVGENHLLVMRLPKIIDDRECAFDAVCTRSMNRLSVVD